MVNGTAGCRVGRPRPEQQRTSLPMPDPESPAAHPTPNAGPDRHWQPTLYGMWLAMFFVFLEGTLGMTFLPVFLQEDMGLSLPQAEYWMGMILAFPSLAMFLAQPIWGMYSDRHGRKPIVIISVVCTSLLRAAWYFAPNPSTILVLGILAGILGSGVIAGQAIVASVSPRERMGEIMGKLATAMTVGFLIGPVVGQGLWQLLGARLTFLVQAAFAFIGAVTVWLAVHERHEKPSDLPTAIQPTGRLSGFAATFTRDLRPLVGNRQLQVLWVMSLVVFFGWSSMWPIMTFFVQVLGVPLQRVPFYAACVMFVSGSLQTVLAPVFGRIGDRGGHKKVLVIGTGWSGGFIALHYFIQTYAQFFGARVMATAAGAAINPTTSALVAKAMPRSRYGGAYGVLASSRALAGSVGPLIGGFMAAHVGIRWVFLWTGALTILAGVWAGAAVREPDGG